MSSCFLKIIAIIAMTIDHAAKIIGQSGLMQIFPRMPLSTSYLIVNLMEAIGRIAFPLYTFMITEGFFKSRSVPKYIGRMALFAIISEPVFYCAFNLNTGSLYSFLENLSRLHLTNVYFTLTLGLTAIYFYQRINRKAGKPLLLFSPFLLLMILFAGYIKCDYGIAGIILIFALHLSKKKWQKVTVLCFWAVGVYLFGQAFNGLTFAWTQITEFSIANCLFAIFPCVLIWLYNGRRGYPLKWSFYIYYPAHLIVLSVIAVILI